LLFAVGWWAGGRAGRQEAPVVPAISIAKEVVAPPAADPYPPELADAPDTSVETTGEGAESAVDPTAETGKARALIALVIDDLGRSVGDLATLEALGVPLAFSVLPFEVLTPEVVAEINRRGWEMLCHLPMEPSSGVDPGPGALTSMMSSEELTAATRAALAAVPGAVGVNNHMGSTLSADARSMEAILSVIKEQGLFYLDSRTSAESVAYRSAVARGIPAAERQVFIDAEIAPEAIEEQFDRLLKLASERGAAVAIGHPHRSTLEVLAYRIPDALARGYEFVPVSFLLDRPSVAIE
jgi:polysaccharide deacetylase 2 family uncharacterized protein YibQ